MEIGEEFIMTTYLRGGYYDFQCKVIYLTEQVIRFHLKCKTQELEVQKIFIPKQRFSWKVLSANFEFTNDKAGENINMLFNCLDKTIKNSPDLIGNDRTKKPW